MSQHPRSQQRHYIRVEDAFSVASVVQVVMSSLVIMHKTHLVALRGYHNSRPPSHGHPTQHIDTDTRHVSRDSRSGRTPRIMYNRVPCARSLRQLLLIIELVTNLSPIKGTAGCACFWRRRKRRQKSSFHPHCRQWRCYYVSPAELMV